MMIMISGLRTVTVAVTAMLVSTVPVTAMEAARAPPRAVTRRDSDSEQCTHAAGAPPGGFGAAAAGAAPGPTG
jgi:hypothetical protein